MAEDNRRVKSVSDARSIYNRLITDNELRSSTFAQVRNQLEGGRPKDPSTQAAAGADWECNVNFGDAQASRDRTLIPYWKMINDVPHKANFIIDTHATQQEKWQIAYAEAYDDFVDDWNDDYFQQFMRMCSNYVNFGPGVVQFDNPETARYKSINATRMLFPKNTQMSLDQWECVALVRDVSVSELYGHIRDKNTEKRSAYAGWNVQAIKQAIMDNLGGGSTPDYRDYTRYQDALVNNDIATTTPYSPIAVVYLYVKGWDGKVMCRAFTPSGGEDDFLYEDDEVADSFRQIFGAHWYDTGTDGMIHSIKGFGIKNYFYSMLQNRMKSRLVDSATFSLGVNFQYEAANEPTETPPVENYGAFTVFPSGLRQLAIYPQLQQATGVLAMLESNSSENNSQYRTNNEQIANSDTATQAKILAAVQGQVSVATAAIFLSQYSETIAEQVRRLRKKGNRDDDAKNFQRRLKERGVPDEVIFDTQIRVRTGANAGSANPALRAQNFQEGLQLMNMPGVNGRWFLEGFIADKYGSNALNKALIPVGQDSEPVQRRQAIMENVDFGQGVPLMVAQSDAHFEHMEEHMKPISGIVQQYKQQGQITPEQAVSLTIGMEHSGQHMTYLQQDETQKDKFNLLVPTFRLLQSTVRGILVGMQNQQNAAQQGGPTPGGKSPIIAMNG